MSENEAEHKLVKAVRHLDDTLRVHLSEISGNMFDDSVLSVSSKLYEAQKVHRPSVTVYIRTVFLKIGEIDTIKENFSANVYIQARWREPTLDNYPPEAVDAIDWDKMWLPKLYIENLAAEPKETIWHKVTFDERGRATAFEKRRLKGTFMENMELKEFPFDTQDLTVSVASELLENEVYLEEDRSELSSLNTQSFIDEQEWNLHKHVEVTRRTLTSEYDNIRRKPIISTTCRAKRRPGFFIYNILLVMLFICTLSFATFSVSIAKPQNRLQLSFTLVLTTIAFKFVAAQSLPKISYLTYLDKYILTSMGILCSICVWHAIVPLLMFHHLPGNNITTVSLSSRINYDTDAVDPASLQLAMTADMVVIIVLATIYVMFHVIFLIIVIVQAKHRQSKDEAKDIQYEEQLEATQMQTLSETDQNKYSSGTANSNKVAPLSQP